MVIRGTSALTAHVWFLYRLAGLGDWGTFIAAYNAAGLSGSDESPDAPLRQVQMLNTAGVDIEPYRLTAAALSVAAQTTGRVTDPYPVFREVTSTELLGSCSDDPELVAARAPLPPPAVFAPPLPALDQSASNEEFPAPETGVGEPLQRLPAGS